MTVSISRLESGAAIALASLNPAYLSAALAGAFRNRTPLAAALLAYIVMRSLLLATLENPEPRYTLEAFPILFVYAAAAFARKISPGESPGLRSSEAGLA